MYGSSIFINAFARLGEFLQQFTSTGQTGSPGLDSLNRIHYKEFRSILDAEPIHNPWFTTDFLSRAINGIAMMMKEEILKKWLSDYNVPDPLEDKEKTIGLILAGNIPMVGFHDILCVLAAGHHILAKLSSKDSRLLPKIASVLEEIEPSVGSKIRFTEGPVSGVDAVIATGSNNSSRYFDYYFRNIPHIIRKDRNSVAVLTGNETLEELACIGEDIFTYFGLGCRNVTKLYVPESYDLKILLEVLDRYSDLSQHNKYSNNVDYYRTIYLMNRIDFLDNGVLLVKEDPAISSPVGVVFYERYSEIDAVRRKLASHKDEIQCLVSVHPDIDDALLPGSSQEPMPWDYADKVDTISFLTQLK